MNNCPCGSNKDYALCCGPLIKGEQAAAAAEQLMRSRYSAYVMKEMAYLLSSLHPDHRKDYDEQSSRAWAERAEWHGITIHKTTAGAAGDSTGTVEFTVFYTEKGIRQEHHEVSTFEKKDGSWFFTTGKLMPKPAVRAAPKVGRNDLCSCGSGKKFKKCCGK